MSESILSVFKARPMIMMSWGFNSPISLDNGLMFKVRGFKYSGEVEVLYDSEADLFDVKLIQTGEIISGVFLDMLVSVVDNAVERVENYQERIEQEYSLV